MPQRALANPIRAILSLAICSSVASFAFGQSFDPSKLRGIVVDHVAAELTGEWTASTSVRPFIGSGYAHDGNKDKGKKSAKFTVTVPADGEYEVLLAYTHGTNRDKRVPVEIRAADKTETVFVDQSKHAAWSDGFEPLGRFRFKKADGAVIIVANNDTKQHVIIDAVRLIVPDELKLALEEAKKIRPAVAPPTPKPKVAEKKPPAAPPVAFKQKPPTRKVAQLVPEQLDDLLRQHGASVSDMPRAADEEFFRRVTLDAIGRQPTPDELLEFTADTAADKRARAIERLLASSDYGRNWADYWSDVIGYRQQEPQLTFHDYGPLKAWLTEQFNSGATWDETVFRMLTARGKVGQNPEATFIGFHQGDGHRLAGETTRVFLSMKIHCAECHDHPFIDMPQEVFHGMAAFFARTEAKVPQLDSNGIEVKSKDKGEQRISGKKDDIAPTTLNADPLKTGIDDIARRKALAEWVTSGDNPCFARSYVNHVWSRLMGRGFAEPVDDLGEEALIVLPEVHDAVADHLIANKFDHRSLFRLLMNTKAYQRALSTAEPENRNALAAVKTQPLRGDEVFQSLVAAIELENVVPPREAKTGAVRFPPPPKSTRDKVNEAFGFDPSFTRRQVLRTMKQAMFMMNNEQLNATIAAWSDDETFLSKLLAEKEDDREAIETLFQRVLARSPKEKEMEMILAHIGKIKDRAAAFEDILWSLINSAEFTTRK